MKYPYINDRHTVEYMVLSALEARCFSRSVGAITGCIADDLEHQCSKRVVTTRQVSAALQRLQKSNRVHQPGIKGYWQLTL